MEHKARKHHNRHSVTELDVNQVIKFLSRQFRVRTETYGRVATAGTKLHELQVEFSYLLDEIKRGPKYQVGKVIAQANEFLESIEPATEQAA